MLMAIPDNVKNPSLYSKAKSKAKSIKKWAVNTKPAEALWKKV